jgi:hypothetical protein
MKLLHKIRWGIPAALLKAYQMNIKMPARRLIPLSVFINAFLLI